jgi:uncharacterized protein (TIGR03437 family)
MKTLILVLWFAIAARADVSETAVLQTDSSLNLETGSVGGSADDLLWTGSILNLQNGAKNVNLGVGGTVGFNYFTQTQLTTYIASANSTPIPAAQLTVGDLFLVVDHAGNPAKVVVLANNGSSILLEFLTYSAKSALPAITQLLNNSSQTPFGYPNYGIAPSSLFVVIGSNLADPGTPVLQSSADPGLPLTLNGASISVTVKGVTTVPPIYYTSPTQLAAVLPAATPAGFGTLTVTYHGNTSAPIQIQVVPNALGFNFYYTNSAAATDAATGTLLTFTNSGTPGEVVTLWATGLGADPADSDSTYTSSPHAVNAPLQIYIGGVQAPVSYQGASTYPGVNQINVTIPDTVGTGCFVTLVAVAGGVTSNTVSIPVNKGGGSCVEAASGLTGNQILGPELQVLRTGLVAFGQTNSTDSKGVVSITNFTDAAFVSYKGLYSPGNPVSPGGCILNDENLVPVPAPVGLDVGTINLTGPNGLNVTLKSQGIKGTGYALLPATAIPVTGGSFTFTMSGGKDVGAFSTTVVLSNPLLNWTNSSVATSIDRTQPMTVTWAGGNTGEHAFTFILGSVTSPLRGRGFTCLATASAGKFTVPAYILAAVPAGPGGAQIQNSIQLPMSAPGIDIGTALGQVSISVVGTYK